jgi:hypothetical protein
MLPTIYAAGNNTAPSGWLMSNRERAKWAMGQDMALWGAYASTHELTVTGLTSTDTIWGVIDMTTAGTAQATLANCTPITDGIHMTTGTPFTEAHVYLVLFRRPQADDR